MCCFDSDLQLYLCNSITLISSLCFWIALISALIRLAFVINFFPTDDLNTRSCFFIRNTSYKEQLQENLLCRESHTSRTNTKMLAIYPGRSRETRNEFKFNLGYQKKTFICLDDFCNVTLGNASAWHVNTTKVLM